MLNSPRLRFWHRDIWTDGWVTCISGEIAKSIVVILIWRDKGSVSRILFHLLFLDEKATVKAKRTKQGNAEGRYNVTWVERSRRISKHSNKDNDGLILNTLLYLDLLNQSLVRQVTLHRRKKKCLKTAEIRNTSVRKASVLLLAIIQRTKWWLNTSR